MIALHSQQESIDFTISMNHELDDIMYRAICICLGRSLKAVQSQPHCPDPVMIPLRASILDWLFQTRGVVD